MECIQSLVHEGNGCRVKCLSGRAVVVVYDKVVEFWRLKLGALMMGGGGGGEGRVGRIEKDGDSRRGTGRGKVGQYQQQLKGISMNSSSNYNPNPSSY